MAEVHKIKIIIPETQKVASSVKAGEYSKKVQGEIAEKKNNVENNYLKDSSFTPTGNATEADFETRKNKLGYMIEHKEPAYLTVTQITRDVNESASVTKVKNLLGQGSLDKRGYMDFILTGYAVTYDERLSVSETFSVPFISFYGKKVAVYNFSAVFRNDDIHKEWTRFKKIYDTYLRAPIAIENNYMLKLVLMDNILNGFITNLQVQQREPYLVNVNMGFVVVSEGNVAKSSVDTSGAGNRFSGNTIVRQIGV